MKAITSQENKTRHPKTSGDLGPEGQVVVKPYWCKNLHKYIPITRVAFVRDVPVDINDEILHGLNYYIEQLREYKKDCQGKKTQRIADEIERVMRFIYYYQKK